MTPDREQHCHPEPAQRREGSRKQPRARLGRSLSVFQRIGMTSMVASAVCLTTLQPAFAIGGFDTPPAPSAKHATKFPTPKETRLENGLRVIVVERPGLPLLAAQLVIRSGAEVDPPNLAGAASMTGSLLTKGTETMSAPEIASAIESLGGSIDSGAGWDFSAASLVVMSNKADPALKILADVVRHPVFKQEEIDRLKNQLLDGLRVAMEQPGSLARFAATRVVFGAGAYGHIASGTLETVQGIGRPDIVQLYEKYYEPRNAAFVLAGDLNLEQGKAFAEKYFGDWKNAAAAPNESFRSGAADWKPESVVIDMPEAGQAAVMVARPAIKRASPDYYTGLVANAVLGNGFVSRLNREIRIKRGLSYGAGSSLDPRREDGPFSASAQTKNESAAEVAGLMEAELKNLVTHPVKDEELKSRQAVLTGRYARALETNQGFASKISDLAVYDLPLDTLDKYIPSIDAVTRDAVTDFAKKYLAQPMSLVIAGKAGAFLDALKKTSPDVKVIEQKDLDLNRADLTKAK
jgi:zinc protease